MEEIARKGVMVVGTRKKRIIHPALWLGGISVFLLLIFSVATVRKDRPISHASFAESLRQSFFSYIGEAVYRSYFPVFFRGEKRVFVGAVIDDMMPFLNYAGEEESRHYQQTVWLSEEDIYDSGMEHSNMEIDQALEELLLAENTAAGATTPETLPEETQDMANIEQEEIGITDFMPHELIRQVDINALRDYETLVKECYAIDPNTLAGSDQLNVDKLLEKDLSIDKEVEGPQILIYHTHSQEAYADSVPGDVHTGIMGVGEYLTSLLTERYGYRVLHHMGQYDVESRDDAYSTALPEIERILAENPSIQVVIDLHRDEMPEETKLVMDLDGRPTARFMFFNGMSRTRKTGNIDYLYNENLDDNLAFSFQMQLAAMEYYPGLTRKIYLKGYRYNMHLRPRNLLVELGAQNNTVEEAMNACEPLAHILDIVLSGQLREQ